MSLVQPSLPDRRPSPGLSINLSSNNPFRNRAISPAPYQSLPSPESPRLNERPMSRNPFFDISDNNEPPPRPPPKPAVGNITASNTTSSQKSGFSPSTAELFNNLSLNNGANGMRQPDTPDKNDMPPPNRPPRAENLPPNANGRSGAQYGGHRMTRSQEEELRARSGAVAYKTSRLRRELDIFADPADPASPEKRRPRRNSDSSVMENRPAKVLDPEEERRRKERRYRDREARKRDEKVRPGRPNDTSKSKKPNQRLDIIDKLDVTSIYGTGLFHHDGPFDACNPHRNRKGSEKAPMQAFPKGSANNNIGGSGPVNKNPDYNQFHGRGAEGFTDYAASSAGPNAYEPYGAKFPRPGVGRTESFSATARVDPVHGDESMGLGTSTFLEGAPAAKVAIQRRESESEPNGMGGAGIQRKKSLAQKIRGISNGNRPNFGPSARMNTSPEPQFKLGRVGTRSPTELVDRPYSPQSAGGIRKANETGNSFFNEYDKAYDRKGESIKVAEEEKVGGRARAPSSPIRGLSRRVTNDGTGEPESKPMGFLNRVKSLKGGRRPRPERKEF
ncbi:MAG: hypothetical protein M1827_004818 [Pycnora praestabilis]|nr:MAG: hypothetical protein M1827_004818 [Pycnora praestabilis]